MARDLARADPRNARLHSARSLFHYLPFVALYPLYPEVLFVVVVFGAALWLGFQSLIGLWLGIPLLAGVLAHLIEIVAETANGHGTPPTYSHAHLVGLPLLAFKALLLMALAVTAVAIALAADVGWIAWAVLATTALVLPASLVLLGLSGALSESLDPRNVFALIVHGGLAYMSVALLCMVLLYFAPELLPTAPRPDELAGGRAGWGAAGSIATLYLALAAAHLLGAMVFIRREALGLRVTLVGRSDDEHALETLQESVARCWVQVEAALMAEDDAAAERLVRTHPYGAHPPHPFLEAMFDSALARPKPYLVIAAGERLLAHLIAIQRWPRALEVFVHASERWSKFQPALPADRVRLATTALERGHALAFSRLTHDSAAAGAVAIELTFLAARWRAERDGDEVGARALLAPLLQAPVDPTQRRIAAYVAALVASTRR